MSYKVKGYVTVRNDAEKAKGTFTARADTIESLIYAQASGALLASFSRMGEISGNECKVTFYIREDENDVVEGLCMEWGKIEKRKV